MVKLASSPYGIWLYSYINHSNSRARRIKRVRGQRLRLDLAERICLWVLASYRMACDATMDRALLAPRWPTTPPVKLAYGPLASGHANQPHAPVRR